MHGIENFEKTILCLRLLGWDTTGLEPLYAFCALRLYRLEDIYCILPIANGKTALSGPRSPRYPGFTITLCPLHSVVSSGRVISPTQKPLPNNKQHSQQRDIQTHGGIRTHNPTKGVAAEPHLRPRGHWDKPTVCSSLSKNMSASTLCHVVAAPPRPLLSASPTAPRRTPFCRIAVTEALGVQVFIHLLSSDQYSISSDQYSISSRAAQVQHKGGTHKLLRTLLKTARRFTYMGGGGIIH
jgi:hypothetical protein